MTAFSVSSVNRNSRVKPPRRADLHWMITMNMMADAKSYAGVSTGMEMGEGNRTALKV